MDQILETNAAVESVRQAYDGGSNRPRPEWVRGQCPQCGDSLVSNCYYVGGLGYLICWECWSSLSGSPSCTYRKVL
jgi:hypothetical protein